MRARLGSALTIAATVLLAGCGSHAQTKDSSPPTTGIQASPSGAPSNGVALLAPKDILAKAGATLSAQSGFGFKGQSTNAAGQLNKMDLEVNGKDKQITVSEGPRTIVFLVLAGLAYEKLPDSMLQVPPGCLCTLEDLKGKFVSIPPTDRNLVAITAILPPAALLKPDGELSKSDVKIVDGRAVVEVSYAKGGTVLAVTSVAADGDPLPVRLTDVARSGTYDFVYGPVTIAVPPQSEIFIPFFLKG
jgi:hypothetical protein